MRYNTIFIKYILILVLFFSTVNAKLSQETIDIFNTKKMELKELNDVYPTYDDMKYNDKKKYSKKMLDLVPHTLFKKYVLKGKKEFKEFLILFAPLHNYQAYFMIDKLYKDKDYLKIGRNLAYINYRIFPKNVSYMDTYLWGIVRSKKDLKIALAGFALILKQKKIEDIQKHYDYTLDLLEKEKEFSGKRAISDIKKVVNLVYFTKNKFDKKQLFKELATIKTDNKDKFYEDTSKILKKYLNYEITLIKQDNSQKAKNKRKTTKYINYSISSGVLYLKMNLLSTNIFEELKNILKNNKYKKIILDLKGNEGGSFISIREIISAFLPNKYKTIFYIKQKDKRWERYGILKDKTLDTSTKLEILIDKKTAKGAMYIASVLSKEKRAKVIGEYNTIDNAISRVIPLSNNFNILLKFQDSFTFDDEKNKLKIWR